MRGTDEGTLVSEVGVAGLYTATDQGRVAPSGHESLRKVTPLVCTFSQPSPINRQPTAHLQITCIVNSAMISADPDMCFTSCDLHSITTVMPFADERHS